MSDKKQTLDEAVEDYCSNNHAINEDSAAWQDIEEAFIAGAQFQAGRMYSKEDLRKAIQLARLCTLDKEVGDFVNLTGLTELCTYDLEEAYSEDSIVEQLKKHK
jgi:hypothetical protein